MPAPKHIMMCHVSDTKQRKIRSRKSRCYWLNFSKRATLRGLTWDGWFLCHVTARTQLLLWVSGRQERKKMEHSFFLMHSPNLCNGFLSHPIDQNQVTWSILSTRRLESVTFSSPVRLIMIYLSQFMTSQSLWQLKGRKWVLEFIMCGPQTKNSQSFHL